MGPGQGPACFDTAQTLLLVLATCAATCWELNSLWILAASIGLDTTFQHCKHHLAKTQTACL